MSAPGTAADALTAQVLPAPGEDAQALAELAALLQEELLELDVAAVEPVPGEAEDDAKGAFAAAAGWLVVRLGPEALKAVLTRLAAWGTRNGRTVEVSIEGRGTLKLVGASREQMDRVLDDWLARPPAST